MLTHHNSGLDLFAQFETNNYYSEPQNLKEQGPVHLQLMERSEYMKKLLSQAANQSSSSIDSQSTSKSSSNNSENGSPSSSSLSLSSSLSSSSSPPASSALASSPLAWGKHRYSTYYERSPFFKNPFSPNNKRAQKLQYISSSISPNASKFVLISADKWLVYQINAMDVPTLLCCGKLNGDFGNNFDSLEREPQISKKINNLQYQSCALSDRLVVLTCSNGSLRVHDVMENGKLFYQYEAGLPIESVDISPNNSLIVCGLQGRNRHTRGSIMLLITFEFKSPRMGCGLTPEMMENLAKLQQQQLATHERKKGQLTLTPPQKFLKKVGSKPSLGNLRKINEKQLQTSLRDKPNTVVSAPVPELTLVSADTKLITLPYKGIVDNVKFNENGSKLILSTFKNESKFMVFDTKTPSDIKPIMKSARSPDIAATSEGITDFQLFGSNDELMVISSNSPNSPPMILNTRLESIHPGNSDEAHKPVQPKRLIKLDAIGTNIHKCCANANSNLLSFLSSTGKIWLAQVSQENLVSKIEVIDQVSSSSCYKQSASIKFSKDGTKMYIVDLQGVLFVQDFSSILKEK